MNKLKAQPSELHSLQALTEELLAIDGVRAGFDSRSAVIQAAKLVKAMRTDAHLTQAELAARMNTTQPEIVRLEAGTGPRGPTMEMLARVAGACNASVLLGYQRADSEAKWMAAD